MYSDSGQGNLHQTSEFICIGNSRERVARFYVCKCICSFLFAGLTAESPIAEFLSVDDC